MEILKKNCVKEKMRGEESFKEAKKLCRLLWRKF